MNTQKEAFPKKAASLYKLWTLDCIIELGYAISKDFIYRPDIYSSIKPEIAKKLADLQGTYGFSPNFPNMNMRMMLMKSIYGESDGIGGGNDGSKFQSKRALVINAAAGFMENALPAGLGGLRERILSHLKELITPLANLEGTSFDQTFSRINSIFTLSTDILRDEGIYGVFRTGGPIDAEWPINSNDQQGALLVQNITEILPDIPYGKMDQDRFIQIQRIAAEGAQSIAGFLDPNVFAITSVDLKADKTTVKVDEISTHLYTWGSELGIIESGGPRIRLAASNSD